MLSRPLLLLTLLGLTLTAHADERSLYDRLGGKPNLAAIVDEFADGLANEPRLNRSFRKVDMKRFRRMLNEQLCELAGGPCKFSGDSMKDVHAGLHITDSEFLSAVDLLRTSMVHHGVGLRERNEMLALLAPMKHDVVQQ